jgi:hypothetical protein
MYSLASRDITAVDGAPVPAAPIVLPRLPLAIVASHVVTVTGAPATFDMRAAIEASPDGGTTWYQVVRFKDITNAAALSQIVRGYSVTAISAADIVASVLGNAAAAAVLFEPPWEIVLRAVTKLQTLTGGTSPHVLSAVQLDVR